MKNSGVEIKQVKILWALIFLSVFILPSDIYINDRSLSTYAFMLIIPFVVMFNLKNLRFSAVNIFFIILITLFSLLTNSYQLILITQLMLFIICTPKFIEKLNSYHSSFWIFLAILFTFIYSLISINESGAVITTAVKEINTSGFTIFCLGNIIKSKNSKLGYLVLIIGIFSWSRNYYIALLFMLVFDFIFLKKDSKLHKKLTFNVIISISLILSYFIGIYYINQFTTGNLVLGYSDHRRLFTLLDYSNYYRFSTNVLTIENFIRYPQYLLSGFENSSFINVTTTVARVFGLEYNDILPHNLFFAYLKSFGITGIISVFLLGGFFKKIITRNNFPIFLGLIAYAIFVGKGFSSNLLFLSVVTLCVNSYNKEHYSLSKGNLNRKYIL